MIATRLNLPQFYGFVLFALALAAMNVSAGAADGLEKLLFRRPLECGREIVVVRGPNHARDDSLRLVAGVGAPAIGRTGEYFSLRLELRAPGRAPLLVAGRLGFEELLSGSMPGGFDVLDLLMPPEKIDWEDAKKGVVMGIVLATAENGRIVLSDVDRLGFVRGALLGNDWTRFAAIVPVDRAVVKLKLSRNSANLIQVDVDDLRPHFKRHTCFIQAGKDWKFTRMQPAQGDEGGQVR